MSTEVKSKGFKRFYVWELPVRVFHWVNAASITLLIVTGFLIGSPLTIVSGLEASHQFWFGTIRFLHFAAAYIMVINFAQRIYWGFFGNEYSRWNTFIPTDKGKVDELVEVLKVDILQATLKGKIARGHNALAGIAYLTLFLVVLFQIVTGFGMYAQMTEAWFPQLFAWAVPLFGGDYQVRFMHHLVTWFFVIFTIVHVYITFYHDYVEGRGTVSSMVGGWKFDDDDDEK